MNVTSINFTEQHNFAADFTTVSTVLLGGLCSLSHSTGFAFFFLTYLFRYLYILLLFPVGTKVAYNIVFLSSVLFSQLQACELHSAEGK